jgi:AcrR family transcriptional regulator
MDQRWRPEKNLSSEDWIKAAFRALSEGGAQAIRVEAIARSLKVSKGSFYWHFKDAPALKGAMLRHWTERATAGIIEEIEANAAAPAARLRLLVSVATSGRSSEYGGEAVEGAIREWARHDGETAAALKAVDEKRIAYLVAVFLDHGFPPDRSKTNAHLLYGALIGLTALSAQGLADLQGDMSSLLETLLRHG